MKAFITGISGQDGSYLAEYLLSLGYEVYGMIRRHSVAENQQYRLELIRNDINVFYGDMTDVASIEKILNEIHPDEIYNLAAQSHVRISFDTPQYTAQVNGIGVLNILDAYRRICPDAKYYQASSSEMFGLSVDKDGFQRETTPFKPTSPYGCAKAFGFNSVGHYRRAYNLHACNGILFNHESPRRGANFVSSKIVIAACRIKLGLQNELELGNMDSYRDWGDSRDYVKAMHKIINHFEPDDFVISSMQTRSVRDMCDIVFQLLNLNLDYVTQNPKFLWPEELPYLKGDSTKARKVLDWKPEITFEQTLQDMIKYHYDYIRKHS